MSIAATPGGAVGCTSTGRRFRVDRAPDRLERGGGERLAVDVGEHHDAARTGGQRAIELDQREIGILPRQRSEPFDAPAICGARGRHVVVHDARRLEAHVATAPVTVGTGQRHDADVDAMFVHRLEAKVVVEHRRDRRHERSAIEMDRAQAATHRFHRVAWRAVLLQQPEPRLGEAMGVDVDDGAGHLLAPRNESVYFCA